MNQSLTQSKSREDTNHDPRAAGEAAWPEKKRTSLHKRLLALVQGEYDYARPRRGQIREGVILDIGDNDMIVDIGAKRDGIVPPSDLDRALSTWKNLSKILS